MPHTNSFVEVIHFVVETHKDFVSVEIVGFIEFLVKGQNKTINLFGI